MSEFSNSFHLRSNEMLDGVELLQRAHVQGFVFRPANGWVPIVFPHGAGMEDKLERILAANRHLAVHYDFAEDHGVGLDAYRGQKRVAKLSVSFETKHALFDSAKLVEIGLMSETSAREIQQWIDGSRDPGLLVVAAALGLPRHSWFSYDYASRLPVTSRDERVEVSKDGAIVIDEENVPEATTRIDDVDDTTLGPLFHIAQRLVLALSDDDSLVLTDDADVDVLAEAIVAALSDLDGARPEVAVMRCLTEHVMVDEVFADEAAIAASLRSATAAQAP